ncbi:MAG: class I SAM-dependent methyltransferase [Rhodospirillales bacterium]
MSDAAAARKAQTRQQFNALADAYDGGAGCFRHFGRRLVEAAGVAPGQRVLDIASGRGAVLFPAAERVGPAGEAVGIDIADEMARAANADAARQGIAARVRVMDAEALDFPDAAFDRVLCGFGVMFFPDQARALAECRRVLKPGGAIGLTTWRSAQTAELEAPLREVGVAPPLAPGWITEPEILSRLLSDAGFSGVRVTADTQAFRYAAAEDYWQSARGTGMRRALDELPPDKAAHARAALSERLGVYRRPDGYHVPCTALLAVARR